MSFPLTKLVALPLIATTTATDDGAICYCAGRMCNYCITGILTLTHINDKQYQEGFTLYKLLFSTTLSLRNGGVRASLRQLKLQRDGVASRSSAPAGQPSGTG